MNFYRNGNYIVCIQEDGTKIRRTEGDDFVPEFPENIDVKITSKCYVGCHFCYENCTKEGKHADLFKYPFIESLRPYTEMALNGNNMDHPDLERFLMFLRDRKVFANITLHQLQFMGNYMKVQEYVENGLIHGVGVSYAYHDKVFIDRIKSMANTVIHTINGILSPVDLDNLKGNDLKLLILGYKNLGRGRNFFNSWDKSVKAMQHHLYNLLPTLIKDGWFKLISFDNLAIEQLNVRRLLTEKEWQKFYMGDDGEFTFYIDMVEGKFAKNSLSQERFDIGNKTIEEMFKEVRK